jgi:hypothetical protein
MRGLRVVFLMLALLVAFGATPAAAAVKLPMEFSGASPTLAFQPPTCQVGVQTCAYIFTNQGTGTILGRTALSWYYDERGTVLPGLGQRIDSATYTIALLKGKKGKPGKPVVLHVIPSSYMVTYDNPATAPCSSGTFSARTREGATVRGTFDCYGGVPSGSMEFTIELGSHMERALDDDE